MAISAATAAIIISIGLAAMTAFTAAKPVFIGPNTGAILDIMPISDETPPDTLLMIEITGPTAAARRAHLMIIFCVSGDNEFHELIMSLRIGVTV